MPTISSDQVQQLRSKTGAGMMECKRALETSSGDMEAAIKILREKGAASAAKRAGRTTGDGLVTSQIEGKTAVLLELNCETDFVARTDDFLALIGELAKGAATSNWKTAADAPQARIQEVAGKLGENINLRRFTRFDREQPGIFAVYIHPSGNTGKIGVLVDLDSASSSEEVKALARDLAMQVAATSPRWVKREDIPANIIEQEKAIGREQAKRENKPEKIWDKIVDGKLQQFYQQFCLLEQVFIKDSSGKATVKSVLEQASAKAGSPLTVKHFVRYKVGEEE